jgi:hypothetical protein
MHNTQCIRAVLPYQTLERRPAQETLRGPAGCITQIAYTFLTLFNNTVSVALFNYSKLHTIVFMVISPTIVSEVKKCV